MAKASVNFQPYSPSVFLQGENKLGLGLNVPSRNQGGQQFLTEESKDVLPNLRSEKSSGVFGGPIEISVGTNLRGQSSKNQNEEQTAA